MKKKIRSLEESNSIKDRKMKELKKELSLNLH